MTKLAIPQAETGSRNKLKEVEAYWLKQRMLVERQAESLVRFKE